VNARGFGFLKKLVGVKGMILSQCFSYFLFIGGQRMKSGIWLSAWARTLPSVYGFGQRASTCCKMLHDML
jgi:hypothetical protein